MGVNFDKAGLIYGALAYQLHLLTMQVLATDNTILTTVSRIQAIQAFLIIAYILYLVSFILLILKHFGVFSDKIADIVTIVLLFVAAGCAIVGVALDGILTGYGDNNFPRASYVIGALSGITAAIFLLLPFCGVGSK